MRPLQMTNRRQNCVVLTIVVSYFYTSQRNKLFLLLTFSPKYTWIEMNIFQSFPLCYKCVRLYKRMACIFKHIKWSDSIIITQKSKCNQHKATRILSTEISSMHVVHILQPLIRWFAACTHTFNFQVFNFFDSTKFCTAEVAP
jgi:hypothetical protein